MPPVARRPLVGNDSWHLGERSANVGRLADVAEVLVSEGIRALEFPIAGPEALSVVTKVATRLGGAAYVGAGTVRNVADAQRAIDADANFRVAPSMSIPVRPETDARAWLDAGAVALGVGSDLIGDSMATGDYDAARTSVREWLAIVASPAWARHLEGSLFRALSHQPTNR